MFLISNRLYLNLYRTHVNIITEWISNKGTMFDLYTQIRDLNISKGYGAPQSK